LKFADSRRKKEERKNAKIVPMKYRDCPLRGFKELLRKQYD